MWDDSPLTLVEIDSPEVVIPCVGDWVLVRYDDNEYPGEVVELGTHADVKVRVMRKAGQYWNGLSQKTTFWKFGEIKITWLMVTRL